MTTKTLNNGSMNPWRIFRVALVLAMFAAFLPDRYHMSGDPNADPGWPGGASGCSMMHQE